MLEQSRAEASSFSKESASSSVAPGLLRPAAAQQRPSGEHQGKGGERIGLPGALEESEPLVGPLAYAEADPERAQGQDVSGLELDRPPPGGFHAAHRRSIKADEGLGMEAVRRLTLQFDGAVARAFLAAAQASRAGIGPKSAATDVLSARPVHEGACVGSSRMASSKARMAPP